MKTRYWILIIVILIIGFFMVFRLGGEDSWIKNERGEYVKHGVPLDVPDYVKEQQDAIICANRLYQDFLDSGEVISSQCLGTCVNYAVDIAHVPRINEDNLAENQCQDFGEGRVKNFIELDKDGNIIKIV